MGNDPFLAAVPGTELFRRQHFRILKLAEEQAARELLREDPAELQGAGPAGAGPQEHARVQAGGGPQKIPEARAREAEDGQVPPSQFLPVHAAPPRGLSGLSDGLEGLSSQGNAGSQTPGGPGGSSQSLSERAGTAPGSAPATSSEALSSGGAKPSKGPSRKLEYTNCATAPPRAGFDLQILGGAIVGQALLAVAHDWVTGGQPANLRIQWQRCGSCRLGSLRFAATASV